MLDKNLINQGVTAEDLEKAASVRLFEKAAAAQGIDLNQFSTEDVEELYNNFVNGEDQMDAVEIFEKVAEAEGIELDTLEDEQLAGLFNHFVENVLPEMIAAEEGGEVSETAEGSDDEEVDEAYAKLAEAEILGRHMARAFADEQEKLAADNAMVRYKAPEAKAPAKPGRGARAMEFLKKHKKPLAASGAVGLAGLGTLAYVRSRKNKKPAEAMKSASALEKLAELAVTDAGHAAAARRAKARKDLLTEFARTSDEYTKEKPGLSHFLTGDAMSAPLYRLMARNAAFQEAKHSDKRIPLNPFGGMLTKTKEERADMGKKASVSNIEELAQERALEALIEARAEEILSELE